MATAETNKGPGSLDAGIDAGRGQAIKASSLRLPLSFVKNEGQREKSVLFYELGTGRATAFTREGVSLSLTGSGSVNGGKGSFESVILSPLDGAPSAVEPIDPKEGKINYLIGKDPAKWKTDLPTYGGVLYKNIYPGIDMKFYGTNSELEYDIIVSPGADPSKVRLSYNGVEDLLLTPDGELLIVLKGGTIVQKKPVVYQTRDDRKEIVPGYFTLLDRTTYAFVVAPYDRDRTLVIDPTLDYSTYLGGSADDGASGIAVDSTGNVYVAGSAYSADFPVLHGVQNGQAGGADAFITKLDAKGQSLVYSTYLGGGCANYASAISVDATGNVYVAGYTCSADFPTVNPFQAVLGGLYDAFVAKLNPSGNALLYSTFLGGAGNDWAHALAVDSTGNAYVAGETPSGDFPVANPYQGAIAGGFDGFVAKLSPSGTSLVYSTYLGGTGYDAVRGMAVDSAGNVCIAGETTSADFPIMNPYQGAIAGGSDAFVSKLSPSGNSLVYSTYLGGTGNDYAFATSMDGGGNLYVAGSTNSADFPIAHAYQATKAAAIDAFITKLDPTGASLAYSTYLGGISNDFALAMTVDAAGHAYIGGLTASWDFPTANAYQPTNRGDADGFITKLDPTGASLVYSTYLGGASNDQVLAIAVDSFGNTYIAGETRAPNFPVVNARQSTNAGGSDAFIAKLVPALTVAVSGSGLVTSSPSGLSCTSTCTAPFAAGTQVTVRAAPSTGSSKGVWTGCDSTGSQARGRGVAGISTCTVTIAGDRTVSVSFSVDSETLTASKTGAGSGTLTAAGLTCSGSTCTGAYNYGTQVTVTATPDGISSFAGWTGCDSNAQRARGRGVAGASTCTVAMTGNKTVSAAFTLDGQLRASIKGSGTGSLSAAGLACSGTVCTGTYANGSQVIITATPEGSSSFAGWTGCDSPSGTNCTMTISGAKAVSANFTGACTYAVSPVSRYIPYSGKNLVIAIAARGSRNCPAPGIVSDPWITTSPSAFTHNRGTVRVTVGANSDTLRRNGAVSIGGKNVAMSQAGAPCTITLTPANAALSYDAQSPAFTVTTAAGCPWAAATAVGRWLSTTSLGTGPGNVSYNVAENTTGFRRTGSIRVRTTTTPSTSKIFRVVQGN
jgi:hypothetical protein